MKQRIPPVASPLTAGDFVSGLAGFFSRKEDKLVQALKEYLSRENVFLLNSGTTAFCLILEMLKDISGKKEVVLPAYTAPSLVPVILKAGLRPALCDVSLDTFNIDLSLLPEVINQETLCLIPTYMFGLGIVGIESLKEEYPGIFIVEDCAQAMGTSISGKRVGIFSDISFFSFNRGKNLPTYGGGVIATNSGDMAARLRKKVAELEEQNLAYKVLIPFKVLALSLVVRPFLYNWGYPFIVRYREQPAPQDIQLRKYTSFQAGVAASSLNKMDEFSQRRYDNGMKLINGLKDINALIVPKVENKTKPAFNRLPIVFRDLAIREKTEKALTKIGVDTSRMYFKPVHHLFDLGYKREDFPKASYMAERLLTLPVHPLVKTKDLALIIKTIKETAV